MWLDIDKIADDLGLPRDKFLAGVQRIQREQEPAGWEWVHPLKGVQISHYEPAEYQEDVYDLRPLFTFPPATPSAIPGGVDWSKFPGWLIDHHEGDMLTEELLQRALSDMLSAAPAPAGEKGEQ